MEINRIRLLSEGQLPDSSGGIYNPAGITHPTIRNERTLLMRKEKHHQFHNDSSAVMVIEKIEKLRHGEVDNIYYPKRVGFPTDSKIEDFRLFYFRNQLYAIHTICETKGGWEIASKIKPVISKVSRHSIELVDWCDLPYVPRKIGEKNWLPIVHNDELYILYSLDPLRIFKLEGWSWREYKFEETGLAKHIKSMLPGSSFLSLSAITHYESDKYLGFWHVRFEDPIKGWIYVQGMFILNMKTLKIENFTPPIMEGGDLEGHRPDCIYVSGLVCFEDKVEVYAGEGDSHSVLIELDRKEVSEELGRHEFKYSSPLRVLFRDFGVGDFICMMYALVGWMADNKRGARLYVHNNLQLASAMKIPELTVCAYNGEPIDVDLSSNEDSLPEDKRFTYAEKISGSLKDFYCKRLKTNPKAPNMDHIDALDHSDAIVLFPFAAKPMRCWDIKNWIVLANTLIEQGKRVVICDGFPARCVNLPGEHKTGIALYEVLQLIKGAKVVVANESGGAHMAGLFDTPTIVLSGWLDPEKIYDHTNNEWIFKRPLDSITVDEVLEKIYR